MSNKTISDNGEYELKRKKIELDDNFIFFLERLDIFYYSYLNEKIWCYNYGVTTFCEPTCIQAFDT